MAIKEYISIPSILVGTSESDDIDLHVNWSDI